MDVKPIKTPLQEAADYLQERGISPHIADLCGFKVAGVTECLEALGRDDPHCFPWLAGVILAMGSGGACQVAWVSPGARPASFVERYYPSKTNTQGKAHVFQAPYDWAKDTGKTLYLCESPVKAAALWAHGGVPTVAGCGVSGIHTKKGFTEGWPDTLASALERIVIIFDADTTTNPDVSGAVKALIVALQARYPEVAISELRLDPKEHGAKAGIDDVIVKKGKEWLKNFLASESTAGTNRLSGIFEELNAAYTLCRHPAKLVALASGALLTRKEATDLEAVRCYSELDGRRTVKIVPLDHWFEWSKRNIVDRLEYLPGREFFKLEDFFNLWKDDGCEPCEGDITPFLEVYRNAIPCEKERNILYDSIAWILQNPQEKMDKCFYFVGQKQGTGKSLLANIIRELVGHTNFASIDSDELEGAFNSHFACKRIVLLDDVFKLSRVKMAKVKRAVTDETMIVNEKGVKQYPVRNHAVFIFTANELDAMAVTREDRRTVSLLFDPTVHYPTGDPWWDNFIKWLEHESGYQIIQNFFMERDLEGFNPAFMPPDTEARRMLAAESRNDDEQWCYDTVEDPDEFLPSRRSVYTPMECWVMMNPNADAPSKKEMLIQGHCLKRYFTKARKGGKVRVQGVDGPTRLWCLRPRSASWDLGEIQADFLKFPIGSIKNS